jgi:hypothetical protein
MSGQISESDLLEALNNPDETELSDYDLLDWLLSHDASATFIDRLIECEQDYGLIETDVADLLRDILANVARSLNLEAQQSIKLWEVIKAESPDAGELDYMWDAWNQLLINPKTDPSVVEGISQLLIDYAEDGGSDWVEGFWDGVYETLQASAVLSIETKKSLEAANRTLTME